MLLQRERQTEEPAEPREATAATEAPDEVAGGAAAERQPSGWRRLLPARRRRDREGVEGAGHGWTYGASMTTRLLHLGAAAALLCGPAALGMNALRATDPTPAAAGVDMRLMSRRTAAAEVSTRWVRSWLTATAATSSQLQSLGVPVDPELLRTLPTTAPQVGQVEIRDAVATAPGTWVVTVTAAVTAAGERQPRTRWFSVPVVVDGDHAPRARPVALPAEVPDPGAGVARSLDYSVTVVPGTGPWQTLAGFLPALLAGQGDLTRFTTPGSSIRAIRPAPWRQVQLDTVTASSTLPPGSARDGAQLDVLATVRVAAQPAPASGPPSAMTPMQYQLRLIARGGRWEVSQIQVPQVTQPQIPGPTPAPR